MALMFCSLGACKLISKLAAPVDDKFLLRQSVTCMKNQFSPVSDSAELGSLFALSHERPVLLFKHSLTCPISSAAYQEMSNLEDEVSLIVVQRAREVSREVESLTGIRHESPQAIILRNGKPVWNASHWRIKRSAVEEAMRENT